MLQPSIAASENEAEMGNGDRIQVCENGDRIGSI